MKVCIPATGPGPDASLDGRLGRAPYLVVVDTQGGEPTSIANEVNLRAAQGAGIQTAQRIVESGAEAVVAAHCGPKAHAVLAAAGITIYRAEAGMVSDLAARAAAGELTAMASANVEGHW